MVCTTRLMGKIKVLKEFARNGNNYNPCKEREKLHYLEMKKQIGSEEVKYDRK